jgi:hypothetical protein
VAIGCGVEHVRGGPVHGGEEDPVGAGLQQLRHEGLEGGAHRLERAAHVPGMLLHVAAQIVGLGDHLAQDRERQEHGLDQRDFRRQGAAQAAHCLDLLAQRSLVDGARRNARPVLGRADRPLLEHRLLVRPAAVAPAHPPGLGVVLAARVELDPIPAVLAPELDRGVDQIGRGGLAIVEVAPEGDRRAIRGTAAERRHHPLARGHGRPAWRRSRSHSAAEPSRGDSGSNRCGSIAADVMRAS